VTWWQRRFGKKQFEREPEKELQFPIQESAAKLMERGEPAGIVMGLLVSFYSVRIVKSQLWGVSAFHPWTLFLAPLALLLAAFLACYLQARRATRVDPIIALRYE